MTTDPLKFELRADTISTVRSETGSSVESDYAAVLCHAFLPVNLVLATGSREEAVRQSIVRLQNVIQKLEQLLEQP